MVSDTSGDTGLGFTAQLNRYLTDLYQNHTDVALAVTAQRRFAGRGTVYGGPFFTYGSARRKGTALDNNGVLVPVVHHAKETPILGLCAGFHMALPRSIFFEVEGQFTGLSSDGFTAGASAWSAGAALRFPLW